MHRPPAAIPGDWPGSRVLRGSRSLLDGHRYVCAISSQRFGQLPTIASKYGVMPKARTDALCVIAVGPVRGPRGHG